MKWQDDSLLWENDHMFMQILIYNLIIVLNHAKMHFYYNFEECFFRLDSCPLPAACRWFENAAGIVEGCFGTVGSDLFFLVAMRNLLAVFNGIVSILKSPLCIAFVPTTPGRCCFSAHEVLQILGR